MNTYEITFIVRPDLDDDSIDAVVDQVLGRIQTGKGEIIATLPWNPARRRMAYPIRDYGDGIYITVTFRLDAQSIRDMENALKLNDRILRFLIVQASELAVKQAQQRLQQRTAAAAAPPPAPMPVAAPPASADAAPAEASAVAEATTPPTATQEGATPSGETQPVSSTLPERVASDNPGADGALRAEAVHQPAAAPALAPANEPQPVTATSSTDPTEE